MGALGAREWVGLGLLALAALIAATFLDAGARSDLPPRTPITGQLIPTPSPEPSPTATPPPPNELEIPEGSWLIEYFNRDDELATTSVFVDVLDLEYANAPFGDFENDNWHLEARTEIDLQPGSQTFTLVHDGAVRVLVDGREVASDADPSAGGRSLVVLFPHEGGRATIRIIATDVDGPLLLRWE